MFTIKRISKDKCINLNRRIILVNSKGKRKSVLLPPIDNGYKMYCWKNDKKGISKTIKILAKILPATINPRKPEKNFSKLKLKIK